jgi:hypothetical protein
MKRRGGWMYIGWSVALGTAAVVLAGCGATGYIVKRPVAEQCSSAGLQKCDALADAVVLYVDGDKGAAEPKLREVAKANSPEKVRVFSAALKPIVESMGGDVQASVGGVLAVLEGASNPMTPEPEAKPEAKAARPPDPGAQTSVEERVGSMVRSRAELVRTGLARPAIDPKTTACDAGPLAADPTRCKKVRAVVGPVTLTNLYAGGGCPDELFVLAGHADNPHWFISAQPNAPLNIVGQFALDDGEELFVGVRSVKDAPKSDARCAVVWSGVRPE